MTTESTQTMTAEPTLEHERTLLQRLLALVADRARREREIETRHAGEVSGEQRQYHEVFQLLTSTYESEQATLQHGHDARVSSAELRFDSGNRKSSFTSSDPEEAAEKLESALSDPVIRSIELEVLQPRLGELMQGGKPVKPEVMLGAG